MMHQSKGRDAGEKRFRWLTGQGTRHAFAGLVKLWHAKRHSLHSHEARCLITWRSHASAQAL
eukprot:3479066-Pleurochrysis_carterae.AAC.1